MPQLIRVPIADARHQTGISEGAGESAILMPWLPSMKSVTIIENGGTVQVSVEHDYWNPFIIAGFVVYCVIWSFRRRASSEPKVI